MNLLKVGQIVNVTLSIPPTTCIGVGVLAGKILKNYKDVNKAIVRELINYMLSISFSKDESMVKTIFDFIKNIVNQLNSKSYKVIVAHRSQTTIITVDSECLVYLFELLFKLDYNLEIYHKVIEFMILHNIEPSESNNIKKGYKFNIDNNVMNELLSLVKYHLLNNCIF